MMLMMMIIIWNPITVSYLSYERSDQHTVQARSEARIRWAAWNLVAPHGKPPPARPL